MLVNVTRWILGIHDACEWLRQGSGGIKTQRGFGQCAMVAPGPRMGGDFVSTGGSLTKTPWTMEKYRRFFNNLMVA